MLNKIPKNMLEFNPATKEEMDIHKVDNTLHTTQVEKDKWNNKTSVVVSNTAPTDKKSIWIDTSK